MIYNEIGVIFFKQKQYPQAKEVITYLIFLKMFTKTLEYSQNQHFRV